MSASNPTHRYPIRRAVLGGLGAIVSMALLMLVVGTASTIATTSANSAVAWRSYQLLEAIGQLQIAEEATRAAVLAAVADPSPVNLAAVPARHADLESSILSLIEQVAAGGGLSIELGAAATSANHWYDVWAQPIHAVLASGDRASAHPELSLDTGDQLFAAARSTATTLRTAAAVRRASILVASEEQMRIPVLATIVAALALCLSTILIGRWIIRVVIRPLQRLNETAFAQLNGEPVQFVAERDDEVGALALVLERLRLMVDERYSSAQSEARLAATMNKLSDLIAVSSAEFEVIDGTVRALRRLVTTRRGDVQLSNASRNRLMYAGSWGSEPPSLDTPVNIDRIDRCPAIRRAAPFVVVDVDDDLAVVCGAHRQQTGSLACIPLIAMGQPIGVIHIESDVPITDATVSIAMRIAEQVAVAIANARLITTMESLAMTDGLTGLRNARFFDTYLEQELAAAERDRESLSVLMIDIDKFKQFNDTYGHPAGDEALRVFGRVTRATLRSSDLAARYGGEEFIIALRHTDLESAALVAEKLRDAISRATIDIGPGRSGRMTISVGVAQADPGRVNQKGLLAAADTALNRAKAGGRNRVVRAHHEDNAAPTDAEGPAATAPAAGVGLRTRTPVPIAARRRRRPTSAEPPSALEAHS